MLAKACKIFNTVRVGIGSVRGVAPPSISSAVRFAKYQCLSENLEMLFFFRLLKVIIPNFVF